MGKNPYENDMIILSRMNKQTGLYENILVSNKYRWGSDKLKLDNEINNKSLINIEIFRLGIPVFKKEYFSIEEFEENEINI